jgi:hypothetical protein
MLKISRFITIAFSVLPRSVWFLFCICFMVLFCTACGSADTLFTVIQAALAGVGIVLTGLGALISPSEAAAVEGIVTAIGDGVASVQAAFDAYEANPSGVGLLAALQAAVTSLQGSIPGILAGLNITNPTLAAWVTTLIGLVGKLAASIASAILPKLASATEAHKAGNSAPLKALEAEFKTLTAGFIAAHNAALDASGLPPAVIANVHKHFKH